MCFEIYRDCQMPQNVYQFPVDINCFVPLTNLTLRNSNKMIRLMSNVMDFSPSTRDRWQRSKVEFTDSFGHGVRVEEEPLNYFFLTMSLKEEFYLSSYAPSKHNQSLLQIGPKVRRLFLFKNYLLTSPALCC